MANLKEQHHSSQPSFNQSNSLPNSPLGRSQRTMIMGTPPVAPISMFVENLQHQSRVAPQPQYMPHPGSNPGSNPPSATNTPRPSLVGFDPLLEGSQHKSRPPVHPSSPRMRMNMTPPSQLSPQKQQQQQQQQQQQNSQRGNRSLPPTHPNDGNKITMEQQRMIEGHTPKIRAHSVDVYASSPGTGTSSTIGTSANTSPTKDSKAQSKTRLSGIFKKEKKAGHHRTQSLETTNNLGISQIANDPARASLPNTPQKNAGRKSSMYPGIVSDLMDIKFQNLELPALAKPSPTSFLTGKSDELIRTSEAEAAPFQMEIPQLTDFLVAARLNEFVDNYRNMDQNFDLQQWVGQSRLDLQNVKIPQHIPIAQSILECGEDVSLRGFVAKGSNSDDRLEVAIFEGQRQFMAIFRGTTEQQTKGINSKSSKKKAVPIDNKHKKVEVYAGILEEYMKLESQCFAILDQLTDEEPFCDVLFSGHSFGGAMATIAAFRYANARPMVRVGCSVMSSPKAGFSVFRQMVNSQPNLKVMRLELGQDGKCQLPGVGGSHVGHTLVLHGSLGSNVQKVTQPVLAYNFDAPKPKKFGTKHPDLRSYVIALEEISRLKLKWARDFVGTSGKGVVVNNESRLVV